MRVPADLESSESVLPSSETAGFLLYPHRTERAKGAHLASYLEGTNPILEGFDPPGSSVRGISQARILEWAAISFSTR